MELPESVTTAVETIRDSAHVEAVYGEPIERSGRTIVPVAHVAGGFGGGFGDGTRPDPDTESEDNSAASGSGGGGGGGLTAKPIGAIEITDEQTRFIRFRDRNRLLVVLALGVVIGWVLGRRRG